MKAGIHVILGAAVVTAILSISPDARAWGRSYHGYGHHYGHGLHHGYRHHYGYGRHFGFGYPYYYGHSTILYGRWSRTMGRLNSRLFGGRRARGGTRR